MTEVETLMVWGVIVSAVLSSGAVLIESYRTKSLVQSNSVEPDPRPMIEESEREAA